ncbi:unnamed protein product, partial [Closterium sp. NIES-64]
PQWLQSFTSRLSADLSSAFPSPINHVLVNEYHEGQGIMATSFPFPINHVLVNEYQEGQGIMDGPAYFPCVAILSLGLPGTMVFSPHQRLLEGSSESGRESSEGACEAALDLMHAQHQRLLEGGREEVLGESEREGDGNDVMEREEAGKKNSSGDAVVMRESVALPPRSLLVFKDQAYTGELVWGEAGEWGSSGDAVEMREGVALPPRSLLVFKDQACTGNEISCASPSRAVIETASVTTRRAALIALSAVIAAQCAGERGAAAAAAGEDGKQRGLSVEQVKDIIARDISEGQYFVTGDLTASIYRDDCRFKDPTNDTSGLARYLAAVSILFDPAFSKQELLSIAVTSDKSVTATAMSKQPTAALPPYPDRFYIAARYAAIPGTVDIPEGAGNSTQYSDLTCLALYSLYQQAVHGPCNKPKPWAWNIVELAKWQSWTELGKMAPVEAMRLFVRALEEEDPNWWTNAQLMEATEPHGAAAVAAAEGYGRGYPEGYAAEGFPAMNGAAFPRGPPVVEDMGVMAVLRSHDCINKWVAAPVTGRKPSARYQRRACARGALLPLFTPPSPSVPSPPPLFIHHAAEILDGRMYVVGGNRARFTSDVHVLDLASLAWSKMELSSPANALPPCAGHSLVMLPPVLLHSLPVPISFPFTAQVILDEVTLLCIGGFFKDGSEKMIVRALDVSTKMWRVMKTRGQIPCARGGHSTAKVGSTVWVFGGEDSKRRLLNDVYSLDFTTFVWDKLDTTGTPPLPRAGHTATVYNEHYLTIFGGGSHSMCFNDVHVLDLDAWSLAETYGKVPSPRAGLVGLCPPPLTTLLSPLPSPTPPHHSYPSPLFRHPHPPTIHIPLPSSVTHTPPPFISLSPLPSPTPPHHSYPSPLFRHPHPPTIHIPLPSSVTHTPPPFISLAEWSLAETAEWSLAETYGKVPSPRAGLVGVAFGSLWFIMGGGDNHGEWSLAETYEKVPSLRAGLVGVAFGSLCLWFIMGGGGVEGDGNHRGVSETMLAEWSLAETYGKVPSPRAGLVGVAFGSLWFIMGGGDNHGGVSETMLLDLDSLVWSVVTTSLEKTPLASEGLSVVPVGTSMGPVLVAFGGYNGRYNNEVFLLLPDTAALLRAAEEEEEAAAAATTAAATTTATTAAAAAATDNAAAAAAATAGSASQPPASAPSENSNSQPAGSVTASSAPAAGSAPPPSLPSGAAAALGPTPSAPAALPPPAPTTGMPPATAAGGKQIVRAGSASNIIGAAPPGGIPVGIPGGISGGIPGAAAVPVPGHGPPLPAGAGAVVGVEDGGELSPTSRDAVLLAQLEEAEAAATRAEKVALNARAEASQTAAEARADAWAAIAKAQMEVDLLKQQLATAIKAKQQAEDEMAEGQAKVVAAQAASASAQAEAGQIRKDLNDCRIKVHELEAELAKKSGADGGMATLQKDYAAVKNALADMEQVGCGGVWWDGTRWDVVGRGMVGTYWVDARGMAALQKEYAAVRNALADMEQVGCGGVWWDGMRWDVVGRGMVGTYWVDARGMAALQKEYAAVRNALADMEQKDYAAVKNALADMEQVGRDEG